MRISDWSSDVCSSDLVQALACEVWVARKLARATRHLSVAEAAKVDAGVATALAGEQPGRFFTILEAKIIEANPEAWAARIDADRARRYVTVGRVDETGLRSEEHTSELQSLMRISYAVFCVQKK